MKNKNVKNLPIEYKQLIKKEEQGTIVEVSYSVRNYVNQSRQLVTDQNIDAEEAGRETVEGAAIQKQCNIYLPVGYKETDKDTRYNVLYLLHGVGGDRYEWLTSNGKMGDRYIICNIFDHLIANGDIEPLIVVFPDGRSAWDWTDRSFNSEGTNMLGFYYFDYELRYDLIPFIESQYNTYANIKDTSQEGIRYNRLHRGIGGLSMGGMQSLNLVLGGHRCDSAVYTRTNSSWKNGLDTTVTTPGMMDLFSHVGAFSNAPTSSDGKLLGTSIAVSEYKLDVLYMTCGDADDVAYGAGYEKSVDGLLEAAGDKLGDYYRILIEKAVHDFNVWNNGAYNFVRLSFGNIEAHVKPYDISMTLQLDE